jgi:endo-1,4-beta-xylanase
MTWERWSATHRAGVLRALENWKSRGVPIDALGLQSHIGANNNVRTSDFDTRQEQEWRHFLDAVTAMGYQLLVTEFDVNDNGLGPDIPTRDRAVADYAKAYLDLTLSYTQVKDVLCWGIVDNLSWLQGFAPRADHLENRCTPWDDNYQAKPLYEAMAAAFRGAPQR